MLLPNKTIPYSESVIARFPLVLRFLRTHRGQADASRMYGELKESFPSVHAFVQTLDCLFALGKITLNKDTGGLTLC